MRFTYHRPTLILASVAFVLSQLATRVAIAEEVFDPGHKRAARLLYETSGGLGGLLVGGVAGAAVGIPVAMSEGHASRDGAAGADAVDVLLVPALGALVGAAIVEPSGVYLAGRWSGANGKYWGAELGGAIGIVTATGLTCTTLLLAERRQEDWFAPVLISGILVLPLVGSILGYELTTRRTAPEQVATASSQLRESRLAPPFRPLITWVSSF